MNSTNCSLCPGQMAHLFTTRDYRRPEVRDAHAVYWCDDCGHGRVVGATLTPSAIAEFYKTPYYTHGPAVAPARASWLDRLRARLAWRVDAGQDLHVGEGRGNTLLDIGCGDGTYMQKFAEAGFNVTGVEPDPVARGRSVAHGPVHDGTAESLSTSIADQRFDTVLLSHVLEHCLRPGAAIANARAVMSEGGRLIVEVPNNAARAFGLFGALWPWADVPRHLHFFTERSLRATIEREGFTVTDVFYVGYTRQFKQDWTKTQETIWRGLGALTKQPRFDVAAWRLLAKTAFASRAHKYDSIRVHAELRAA